MAVKTRPVRPSVQNMDNQRIPPNTVNIRVALALVVMASLSAFAPTATAMNCDPLNTACASASAWAHAGYGCYNPATGTYYACWSGGGYGYVYSSLGPVSGTMTGATNGVPLSDYCYNQA